MKLLIALILTACSAFGQAATTSARQTVRPEFRDKTLQAIQDLDDVDVLKSELTYSTARSLARQSVMAVHRLALEAPTPRLVEYEVCDELLAILATIETSRLQQSYNNPNTVADFKKSIDEMSQHREKALTAVGLSNAYAHSRALTEPKVSP